MSKEKDFYDFWAEGQGIPEEELDKWRKDPNREYHCVFCSNHYTEKDFTDESHVCQICREYKGIEPCIPNSKGLCQLDASYTPLVENRSDYWR